MLVYRARLAMSAMLDPRAWAWSCLLWGVACPTHFIFLLLLLDAEMGQYEDNEEPLPHCGVGWLRGWQSFVTVRGCAHALPTADAGVGGAGLCPSG